MAEKPATNSNFWVLASACGAGFTPILSILKWLLMDSLPFRDDGSLAYKAGQLLIGIMVPMNFCFALPIFGAIGGLMVGILSEIIVDIIKSRPMSLAIRS